MTAMPRLDGVDLVALAEERGTPLLVHSEAQMMRNVSIFREAGEKARVRHGICYASKALSAMRVLNLFETAGLLVEVNSGGELFRARKAGFAADRIVFNGVSKSAVELGEALDPPIRAINVDSLSELRRLRDVAEARGTCARLALRLVPEVVAGTTPGNQTGAESTKFGLPLRELGEAIGVLRAAPAALRLVGIHAHIGSQIGDTAPYVAAAAMLRRTALEVEDQLGLRLEHINIGGGFPLRYRGDDEASVQGDVFTPRVQAAEILAAVLPALDAGEDRWEILIEPGRSLVGNAGVMLSRVEASRRRVGENWLYLDAGYNVLVESFTYKWFYRSETANKRAEDTAPFRVVGPLCDNGDAFFDVDGEQLAARLVAADPRLAACRALIEATLIRLPRTRDLAVSTTVGDLIAFHDCGAYVFDQMTPNNGRPRPEVGAIDAQGGYHVIRRRDSYEDLLAGERW